MIFGSVVMIAVAVAFVSSIMLWLIYHDCEAPQYGRAWYSAWFMSVITLFLLVYLMIALTYRSSDLVKTETLHVYQVGPQQMMVVNGQVIDLTSEYKLSVSKGQHLVMNTYHNYGYGLEWGTTYNYKVVEDNDN